MKTEDIITIARQTITEEAAAVAKLTDYIDDDFTQAVDYILHSKGRVVITGIGKSAIIANKIVATMNRYSGYLYARCRCYTRRFGYHSAGRCGDLHLEKR